jgi:hypothetical protein
MEDRMTDHQIHCALGLAFVLALSPALGCSGPFQTEPNYERPTPEGGELEFSREALPKVAVEAEARLSIIETPHNSSFDSLEVEPHSEVVEVVSKSREMSSSPNFVLRASETGDHPVQLRATLYDGRELERTFEFEARSIDDISIDPQTFATEGFGPDEPMPYLVDSTIRVSVEFLDSEGNSLVATGRYPVEWEPQGALELDRNVSRAGTLIFRTGSTPEVVTLESSIGSETQKLELVSASMVEGLALGEEVLGLTEEQEIPTDGVWAGHIVPVYEGSLIPDSSLEVDFQSRSPEVCLLLSDDAEAYSEETGRNVNSRYPKRFPGTGFVVDINDAGACRLYASLPEANGGDGAEFETSVEFAE